METEIKKTTNKAKIKKIVKEYNDATKYEIWEGIRDNFTFGFLAAILIVFIATKTDIAVLLGYITYYFYMGKIVNRPKYVTDLGRLIVFPIPSSLGAFTGYKISYYFIQVLS
jgi:predicted glycosyltransferase